MRYLRRLIKHLMFPLVELCLLNIELSNVPTYFMIVLSESLNISQCKVLKEHKTFEPNFR